MLAGQAPGQVSFQLGRAGGIQLAVGAAEIVGDTCVGNADKPPGGKSVSIPHALQSPDNPLL